MIHNCLTYCLDQWMYLKEYDYKLWYNSDHVIIIESNINMTDKGYLPIENFGYNYFVSSFYDLSEKYKKILKDYFNK
jgi:hypothetical protein